ncbi:hypothetical protein VIGAN_04109200 [Vigna angularis var. angularis]|uniref:Uncharacterized protein n=1 Tax=Vigna angularis var. angularis TaxID=157739 RepID=A0A0S3RTD6_PHAAN|nr:hypothetical protein VIGAN_04109200 [Vigna angularis var. angularis]
MHGLRPRCLRHHHRSQRGRQANPRNDPLPRNQQHPLLCKYPIIKTLQEITFLWGILSNSFLAHVNWPHAHPKMGVCKMQFLLACPCVTTAASKT